MKIGKLCTVFGLVVLAGSSLSPVRAQGGKAQAALAHNHGAPDQRNQTGDLVKVVREATERFRDPAVADAEGYKIS
jgi:hypothetical protein